MRVARALTLFGATLVTTGCPAIIGLDKDYQLADGDTDSGVAVDVAMDVPPENACGMNRLICNGNCIDVSMDPMNCGLCAKKCGMGFACMNSQCTDDIVQVAAGGDHACVVLRGGKVYCWGSNNHAEAAAPTAGDMMCGATRCRPSPTDTGLTDVAEVVLGVNSGCARKNDATVWCWGTNQHLELGHSGGDALCNAIACNYVPKQVAGVAAQKIGAGAFHYCALTMTGAVYCWGNNSEGELGRGGGAGANSAVASIVPALSGGVVGLSSGLGQHSCAVKGDGTVWCWGYNLRGALGHTVGSNGDVLDASMVNYCNGTPKQVVNDVMNMPFTGIDAVTIADRVGCGHKMGGGWWCWGNQGHGALGTGGAFDVSNHAAPIAVSVVPGGVVKLATGSETPCGTDTSSKLFCWGRNDWGAIGDGTFVGSTCEGNTPCHTDAIAAIGLTNVELVDTGGVFGVVKKTDGTVWTWGANPDARLGHMPNTAGDKMMCAAGTTACNPTPSQLMGLP